MSLPNYFTACHYALFAGGHRVYLPETPYSGVGCASSPPSHTSCRRVRDAVGTLTPRKSAYATEISIRHGNQHTPQTRTPYPPRELCAQHSPARHCLKSGATQGPETAEWLSPILRAPKGHLFCQSHHPAPRIPISLWKTEFGFPASGLTWGDHAHSSLGSAPPLLLLITNAP